MNKIYLNLKNLKNIQNFTININKKGNYSSRKKKYINDNTINSHSFRN